MDRTWSQSQYVSNRYYGDSRPVTVADLESYTKNIEKNKELTDEEAAFLDQKRRGGLWDFYKQQVLSGTQDPYAASQSFLEEAKGLGGLAKRTRQAAKLADLRPIPGYDPKTYNKREALKQQKEDILAKPQTLEEKAARLENRGVNIQEKIDALLGSKDYDPTPNRQAEKDVLAQIQELEERKASIDPERDKARADKLRARAAAFDPDKATASLTKRIGELAPGAQYKEMAGSALSTQAKLLGLGKGIVTPQLQKSLIQQAKAQGIAASEMPSYMSEQLVSSQITRPYLLKAEQEQREFDYGNVLRDPSGLITNTYTANMPDGSTFTGSTSDIDHARNINMQEVVNSGMAKVENIRGMSNMLGLIGYALS
jgi:hypothetical protein